MGIKPSGTTPIIVPQDNVQSRWGAWEADLDTAGQQAGEVFQETHAIATSANSVAATALQEARTYQSDAVAATEALGQAIDPEHPDSHIFRLIQSIEEAQNQALELHADAIAANDAAIQELTKSVTRTLHTSGGSDEYWTVSGSAITPKPGWVGSAVTWRNYTESEHVDGTTVYNTMTRMEYFPIPLIGNPIPLTTQIMVYTINPGVAVPVEITNPSLQELDRNTWTTVAEWVVPEGAYIVANAGMVWANKTWAGSYGMRMTLDGLDITTSESSTSAPIIGHGPRRHNVSTSRRKANAGQVLRVQAFADHSNPLNRQLRDVTLNATWIDVA